MMKYKKSIKTLFPLLNKNNLLPTYLSFCESILDKKTKSYFPARIKGNYNKEEYLRLIKENKHIPVIGRAPKKVIKKIVGDFFSGIPRWRSPNLVHNVGSPTNIVASAIYSLALDENIYNIC